MHHTVLDNNVIALKDGKPTAGGSYETAGNQAYLPYHPQFSDFLKIIFYHNRFRFEIMPNDNFESVAKGTILTIPSVPLRI